MGFDGVKKVETDEDEGVSYSSEEDGKSAGVQERAQDDFSLTDGVHCSWTKKPKDGSNGKAPRKVSRSIKPV